MAAKEKTLAARVDDEFDAWAREQADSLDMSVSAFIRQAIIVALPLLRQIPSLRDVQVKDTTPSN